MCLHLSELLSFFKRRFLKLKQEGDLSLRIVIRVRGAVNETDPTQTACSEEMAVTC